MKPKAQFGRLAKPLPIHRTAEHEERAAIHEFDGRLIRADAEARAAAVCQHCGQAAKLGTIFRADYGYNLEVCSACAGEMKTQGWSEAERRLLWCCVQQAVVLRRLEAAMQCLKAGNGDVAMCEARYKRAIKDAGLEAEAKKIEEKLAE